MAWKYFDQPHPRHVPEDVSKLVIDIPVQLLSHLFKKLNFNNDIRNMSMFNLEELFPNLERKVNPDVIVCCSFDVPLEDV